MYCRPQRKNRFQCNGGSLFPILRTSRCIYNIASAIYLSDPYETAGVTNRFFQYLGYGMPISHNAMPAWVERCFIDAAYLNNSDWRVRIILSVAMVKQCIVCGADSNNSSHLSFHRQVSFLIYCNLFLGVSKNIPLNNNINFRAVLLDFQSCSMFPNIYVLLYSVSSPVTCHMKQLKKHMMCL